jgi:hypothetical protein
MATKVPKPVKGKISNDKSKQMTKRLEISQGYLAAQQANDPTNQLAPQVAALVASRTTLMGGLAKKPQIMAEATANEAVILTGGIAHEEAMADYVRGASKLAGTNAATLLALGVPVAARGVKGANDIVGAVEALTVGAGKSAGEAALKAKGVPHAASYIFQYKLEPSQPTDPWLPPTGIITKHVSTTVTGLAPQQLIRARACAVGGAPGPWSAEVVGRAK